MRKFVYIDKLPSGNYSIRHWGPCSCTDHEKKAKEPFFYRECYEDYEIAKNRANKLEARLLAKKQHLPDPTLKPIDIYDKYIDSIKHTHRASTLDLKHDHARPFFETSQHITEGRIKEYKADQLKKNSVSTVSIRLREIRAVCNWAKKEGYLQESLFENIEIPAAKEGGKKLEIAEIKKLFSASDAEFRPFLALLISTGARYGEILKTRKEDINFDAGIWHIPAENCKTNKERFIPLDEWTIGVLLTMPIEKGLLFAEWVENTARWYLKKACIKAELPKDKWPTPHTFRHTFASHWDGDIRKLMDMCGWTTMLMPKRYCHNSTEDLRKEAATKGISANLNL